MKQRSWLKFVFVEFIMYFVSRRGDGPGRSNKKYNIPWRSRNNEEQDVYYFPGDGFGFPGCTMGQGKQLPRPDKPFKRRGRTNGAAYARTSTASRCAGKGGRNAEPIYLCTIDEGLEKDPALITLDTTYTVINVHRQ